MRQSKMANPPATAAAKAVPTATSRPQRSSIAPTPDALTWTLAGATAATGISRRELYRLLAAGEVAGLKAGRRTLIVADTLRAWLASRPSAKFRPLTADPRWAAATAAANVLDPEAMAHMYPKGCVIAASVPGTTGCQTGAGSATVETQSV